ncbi:MAG: hypothetical protein ACRD29_01960 [Acidimicrobiales bacterium]
MRSLLVFAPALACAGGMALMMVLMNRDRTKRPPADPPASDLDVASLRDELDRLRTELRDHDAPTTGDTR